MFNLMAVLITGLLFPKPALVTAPQVANVLDTSVLIRAKQYNVNSYTSNVNTFKIGCSGTYISSNTVLTAAHCFSDPTTEIWVRDYKQNKGIKAYLFKMDVKRDLAVLKVKGQKPHKYAVLAKSVSLGEQIINVGSPFRFEFLLSEGIVAALNVKVKEYKSTYMVTTAMINAGSSGGGAFNTAGELVGVNTMTVGGPFGWAGISMTVDLKSVQEFLKPKKMSFPFTIILGARYEL